MKGDAVEATAAAGLYSNLGDAGGAIPAASAESVASKVSPARHNQLLASRGFVTRLKIRNFVFLVWDCRVASVSPSTRGRPPLIQPTFEIGAAGSGTNGAPPSSVHDFRRSRDRPQLPCTRLNSSRSGTRASRPSSLATPE